MNTNNSDQKVREKFNTLSEEVKPKPKLLRNCIIAFIIGGIICTIGQFVREMLLTYGVSEEHTTIIVPITMIFLGALLTGLGLYDKIASIAGAGTVVPITGFSNSIVAPAIEFKKEGFVMGVGAKMFTIAGPVLVYGLGTSVIVGIIYYILMRIGMVG